MAMVIVILLNVLIAQLSYTYDEAKSNAKLQFAIDRIVIVTRIEYSRFTRLVSCLFAFETSEPYMQALVCICLLKAYAIVAILV